MVKLNPYALGLGAVVLIVFLYSFWINIAH